jgi:iron complex transport system ATP-binding protein
MMQLQNAGFSIHQRWLVKNISLTITPGEFVVIMGANGAGKSTLLKMMAGALMPSEGSAQLNGKEIGSYSKEALAKLRAVLSQHYEISFPLRVEEMVMMGRYPYFRDQPSAKDQQWVNDALAAMQMQSFAKRNYHSLSGGEAQKVQMSRVLAQLGDVDPANPKWLLLDEPVSHLDVKYQHQLLRCAKEKTKEQVGVIAVLHDVNLALRYATRILFMKAGEIIALHHAGDTIPAEILFDTFDTPATIMKTAEGEPWVYFG